VLSLPIRRKRYDLHDRVGLLKKQGLGVSTMDYIFNAIVVNKILYALPVYFGYLTEGRKQMLQRVLNRANRRGVTSHCHDLDIHVRLTCV